MIREPELRWPVVLVAGLATALVVLLTACVISLALARPAAPPAAKPRLVGALMEVTALCSKEHGCERVRSDAIAAAS